MLKLVDIKKNYYVADITVEALKGINLRFRKSEFVSILGPSGCGKTTLLNIIGGLDKYTSGDLVINGTSTKEFTDRDWDVYRNHRIGFIFQSYNLIPHQTIVENVELALTISGVSKDERIERAKAALDKVGLAGQYNKKPNQLSGGQCQRVAIARALVNEPEILLADEPTGALDTKTSVQIMELIKEISKEKLVIMVTHNPDLAYKYSTRIVKFLDGVIEDDSNPYAFDAVEEASASEAEQAQAKELVNENEPVETKKKPKEKAKMSFFEAFRLSTRNLISKLKRTLMVVLAGSIGIIGVATVLSVSQGVKDYIKGMQDDLLSGNPISISESGIDLNALTNASSQQQKVDFIIKKDKINVNSMIEYFAKNQKMLETMMINNKFTLDYVNFVKSMPSEYYNAIALDYGIDITPNVYTSFKVGEAHDGETVSENKAANMAALNKNLSLNAIIANYRSMLNANPDYSKYSGMITSLQQSMSQCVSSNDYISTQYDIVSGSLPQDSHDILVVASKDNEITDLLLTQLGYLTQEEFENKIYRGSDVSDYNQIYDKDYFDYLEILNKTFTYYPNDAIYTEVDPVQNTPVSFVQDGIEMNIIPKKKLNYAVSEDQITDKSGAINLRVCGIVRPKKNVSYGCLDSGFLYSEDFAREMYLMNKNSKIVNLIKNDPNGAMSSGTSFDIETNDQGQPTKISATLNGIYYTLNYAPTVQAEMKTVSPLDYTNLNYLGRKSGLSTMLSMLAPQMASIPGLDMATIGLNSVAGSNLPQSIKIFPLNFGDKDLVTDYLSKWNTNEDLTVYKYDDMFTPTTETYTISGKAAKYDPISGVTTYVNARDEIKYSDPAGLIINMVNVMIDVITYALVAFTALSLVVSTVMVGIITYVSVVERVKEIGVIRALGGRKRDVSNLFNAEAFIIGLSSGVFGIVITFIISIIANVIVNSVSGGAVSKIAHLTLPAAIIMILVSVLLTAISGIIPAASAAKKDPVIALRTE